MVNDYAGAVAVVVVLPSHPAVECPTVAHTSLDVAGDDPAIDLAVGGHRTGGPRVAADFLYIAESDVLVGGEQDAVVATAADVDPAPGQRRVVDLGVGGVPLLGGGVAVVQIAGAGIAATGLGGLLYFMSEGMGCTETLYACGSSVVHGSPRAPPEGTGFGNGPFSSETKTWPYLTF
jgi:hypothetical protein